MPAGSLKTYTLNFLKKTNEIYRDKFLIDVSNTLKNDLADDRGDITRNLFSPSHKIISYLNANKPSKFQKVCLPETKFCASHLK